MWIWEEFKRIWDFLTSAGAFFVLPFIIAVFSVVLVYILPEWPVLRYPLMLVLTVLAGFVGWKGSEAGAMGMVEKGHISEVKSWMKVGFIIVGVVSLLFTAYGMLFLLQHPDGKGPMPSI